MTKTVPRNAVTQATIQYAAQARLAAGMSRETIDLPGPLTIADVLRRLGERHGAAFRQLVLATDGQPHPWILLFVDDVQTHADRDQLLRSGQTLTILPPIGGG